MCEELTVRPLLSTRSHSRVCLPHNLRPCVGPPVTSSPDNVLLQPHHGGLTFITSQDELSSVTGQVQVTNRILWEFFMLRLKWNISRNDLRTFVEPRPVRASMFSR